MEQMKLFVDSLDGSMICQTVGDSRFPMENLDFQDALDVWLSERVIYTDQVLRTFVAVSPDHKKVVGYGHWEVL